MNYIELRVFCLSEFRDILIAEMGAIGFDSMLETPEGFLAYMEEARFQSSTLADLKDRYGEKASFSYEISSIPKENWNEKWEKNFEPVVINKSCVVRASFHEPMQDFTHEIIIDPKMSFGTGHHETTSLMIDLQMSLDHNGKKVLDCGCGTGILSIMAAKLGATSIIGIDTDDWAVENSVGNALLNNLKSIYFIQGTIQHPDITGLYDIILANINKNVLLSEIDSYSRYLKTGGQLILSGFYSNDLRDIVGTASRSSLELSQSKETNDWTGAVFIKM